ncbi:MAG: hypothetical protein JJU05_07860 [Verrucomicrobia bacterium]|nr:hypothetical protein [Verrucomicrobiota bacterium]MCH8527488.1 hypothetical protein [Kiritimatiellia bacterium]
MRKRAGRLLPALLLTGLSLFYLFRPTGEHAPLMNAVSPSAEWVSFHESPGKRYDELLALPWVEHLLEMTDTKADSGTRFWIRELFPKEVLLAREGGMGVDYTPGWVLVSRISGRQTRLRLMLDFFGLDGYERVGKHNGNILWTRFEEGETPMTVTLANGKLIFVVHEDPQAIRDVLERLEGRRHRFLQFRSLPEALLPGPEPSDRGFWLGNMDWPEMFGVVTDFSDAVTPTLRALGPGVDKLTDTADEDANRFAARLGGPSTLAMLRLPFIQERGKGSTHFLLIGGRFRSPLAIVNLPTAVLIEPSETEIQAREIAGEWISSFAQRTGVNWSSVDTRDGRVFLPEDRMVRRFMDSAHRPFAGWREGKMLLSSSESTLGRLEARLGEPAADFELRDVPWLDGETFLWASGAGMAEDLGGLGSVLGLLRWQGVDATGVRRLLEGLSRFELWGRKFGEEAVFQLRFDSQE